METMCQGTSRRKEGRKDIDVEGPSSSGALSMLGEDPREVTPKYLGSRWTRRTAKSDRIRRHTLDVKKWQSTGEETAENPREV